MADPSRRGASVGRQDGAPPGFERLLAVHSSNGYVRGPESVLVPIILAAALNDARRELCRSADDANAWREAGLPWQAPASEVAEEPSDTDALAPQVPQAGADPAEPVVSVPKQCSPSRRSTPARGTLVPVISITDILAHRAAIATKFRFSTAERKAEEKLMDDLVVRGEFRTIGLHKDWRARLAELRSDMPNFSRVIERLEACVALARFSRRPLRIPPLLLAGPPGVGKTYFATRLAGVLGVGHFVYALESAETVSVLTGSDKHWSNSEPGELWKRVVMGEHANPVVVLDELDKASNGPQYRPANALHAVLERVTSSRLRDKSVELAFDASYAVYVATTNRLSSIDRSLLSRFELFHVTGPEPRESVSVARAIARAALQESGLGRRFERPAAEVIQQLALLDGPRQMHQVVQAALGRAVLAGRQRLEVGDLLGASGRDGGVRDGDAQRH